MSHWSKFLLRVVARFQRDSYNNFNDNEDNVSCEWTNEVFVNSLGLALIKRVEDKYESMDGLDQGGINYLKSGFYDMFNISDVVITSLQ